MSEAKSAWNRAHDATREDERQRAMRALHEHIDLLERSLKDEQKKTRDLTEERDQLRVDVRDLRRDLNAALRGERL